MSGLADTCLFPVLGRNQQDNGLGQAAPCNHPAPEGTQRRAAAGALPQQSARNLELQVQRYHKRPSGR